MKKLLTCAFLVCCQLWGVQAQIPTGNLICFYPFNSNLEDQAGANDGVSMGGVFTTDRFGHPNQALYLSGEGSNVDFGDISLEAPEFTISFWMNFDTVFSGAYRILSKREICNASNFVDISVGDSLVGMECYSGSNNSANAAGGGLVEPSRWIHIAFVVDSSTQQTLKYIDGTLVSTKAWPSQMGSIDNSASFGISLSPCIDESYAKSYKGNIDDIRVYDRPLNQSEISQLFNEADPGLSLENESLPLKVNVFPNPATDRLIVETPSQKVKWIKLRDWMGRTVYEKDGISSTVDLSRLPDGTYILSVLTNKGQFSKTILKR